MSDLQLGLFRRMTFAERETVERSVGLSFEDLFNQVETFQFELRELETFLNKLFRGENYDTAA